MAERIEYRVRGNRPERPGFTNPVTIWGPITDRAEAEKATEAYQNGGVYFDVRLETRTVIESDWEQVGDSDG
jgi:hypothetical protein